MAAVGIAHAPAAPVVADVDADADAAAEPVVPVADRQSPDDAAVAVPVADVECVAWALATPPLPHHRNAHAHSSSPGSSVPSSAVSHWACFDAPAD